MITRPRMVGINDYRRCYVLPDEVEANIPRQGFLGECGAWDHARGVLVEICRALPATPVSLHYEELETPVARNPIGVELTVVAREGAGVCVTVVSRRECAPFGARGDVWQVTVDGVVPEDGMASVPPSSPWLAYLVRRTVIYR